MRRKAMRSWRWALFAAVLALSLVAGCSEDASDRRADGQATLDSGPASDLRADGALASGDGAADASGVSPDLPAGAWQPPIGIPAPSFGINEAADSCAACTQQNQGDLNGLENIAPGTVVTVSGGPFSGGQLTISGNGTAANPIIVRGASDGSRPVIGREVSITGSYIIVENFDFDFAGGDLGIVINGDHIAIRNCEIHNAMPGHNSTIVFVSSSEQVVIYNNQIHDNGDFTYVGERDVHGIGATQSHFIWIVDNQLHHNRGDSIQFGHQAGNTLGDFYIGRNVIHDDGENCVDIKEASNVVISENSLHGAAAGYATVVLHDCPENAAVIYNEIHDHDTGVSMASLETACDSKTPITLLVVKNDFHDLSGNAIQGWGTGKTYFITGNTFANVGTNIDLSDADSASMVSEASDGLSQAFSAFQSIYGIDISSP